MLWRGGNELHSEAPGLQHWLGRIGELCESLDLYWGRLSIEISKSGTPCVLAIDASCPSASDLEQLPRAAYRAFLGLVEWMQSGARPAAPPLGFANN